MDLSHVFFVGVDLAGAAGRRLAQGAALEPRPVAEPRAAAAAEPSLPDPFVSWLLARAGLDATAYRAKALQRRVGACVRALRVSSTDSARRLLERRPDLMATALDALLIGVTKFFRDQAVFKEIEGTVIPELLASREGLRACSIGASDGQELYSLAMLLADAGALSRSALLGIDCRSEAILAAAGGAYSAAELADVDPSRRSRYFVPDEQGFAVGSELRANTQWGIADLFSFAPVEPWDLIFFRNVAIYLQPERALAAWEQLVGTLAPGGYLVTGTAEKPPATLPLARMANSIYRRTTN